MDKNYIVLKGFYHDGRQWYAGDKVNFGKHTNDILDSKGLIRFFKRPEILEIKKSKPKAKKNVRKSKK